VALKLEILDNNLELLTIKLHNSNKSSRPLLPITHLISFSIIVVGAADNRETKKEQSKKP